LKALLWDGQGLVLYAKRLERGRFVWPQTMTGTVGLTNAQLSMLLEGIDWRMPGLDRAMLAASSSATGSQGGFRPGQTVFALLLGKGHKQDRVRAGDARAHDGAHKRGD
jgi:IS66 Orf2 like protein